MPANEDDEAITARLDLVHGDEPVGLDSNLAVAQAEAVAEERDVPNLCKNDR